MNLILLLALLFVPQFHAATSLLPTHTVLIHVGANRACAGVLVTLDSILTTRDCAQFVNASLASGSIVTAVSTKQWRRVGYYSPSKAGADGSKPEAAILTVASPFMSGSDISTATLGTSRTTGATDTVYNCDTLAACVAKSPSILESANANIRLDFWRTSGNMASVPWTSYTSSSIFFFTNDFTCTDVPGTPIFQSGKLVGLYTGGPCNTVSKDEVGSTITTPYCYGLLMVGKLGSVYERGCNDNTNGLSWAVDTTTSAVASMVNNYKGVAATAGSSTGCINPITLSIGDRAQNNDGVTICYEYSSAPTSNELWIEFPMGFQLDPTKVTVSRVIGASAPNKVWVGGNRVQLRWLDDKFLTNQANLRVVVDIVGFRSPNNCNGGEWAIAEWMCPHVDLFNAGVVTARQCPSSPVMRSTLTASGASPNVEYPFSCNLCNACFVLTNTSGGATVYECEHDGLKFTHTGPLKCPCSINGVPESCVQP